MASCRTTPQSGLIPRDNQLSNADLQRDIRCKDMNACELVSPQVSTSNLAVVSPITGRVIPVPPGDISPDLEDGPGISFGMSGQQLRAGVGCGTGTDSVVFDANGSGTSPSTSGTGAVAIGRGASATGTNSISCGDSATCTVDNGIAIGPSSSAGSTKGIAMGVGAQNPAGANTNINVGLMNITGAGSNTNVSIGFRSQVGSASTGNTLIARNSRISGTECIVCGDESSSDSASYSNTIAIGRFLRAGADRQIMLGSGNDAAGTTGPAVDGRLIFTQQREALGAGGAINSVADNFIPINWNGQLYYIPCFISS